MKIKSVTKTETINELLFTLLLAILQACQAMREQSLQHFVSRLSENQLKVCKTAPRAIPMRFCRIVENDCQIDRCSNQDPLETYLTIAPCPPRNLLSLLCTLKTNLTCEEKARIFDRCTRKMEYDDSHICQTRLSCASCSEIISLEYFKNSSDSCVRATSPTINWGSNLPSEIPGKAVPGTKYYNLTAELKEKHTNAVIAAVIIGVAYGPVMFLLLYTIFYFRRKKRSQVMSRKPQKQTSVASTKPLLDENGVEFTELTTKTSPNQDSTTSQNVETNETIKMIDDVDDTHIRSEEDKDPEK